MLKEITPLILTYNEAPNIERTLERLYWAEQIIVIDSFSEDATVDILQVQSKVQLYQRTFDTHTQQWNYGLEKVSTPWVLSLDADYVLTEELIQEIAALNSSSAADSYFVPFKYCVFGKALKGSILPPRQALFKKEYSRYIDDGHTQLLQVKGSSKYLKNHILHDDRKPFSRWLWAQQRYMVLEAKKLRETPLQELSLGDKIRKQKVLAPFVVLVYCLVLKRGIFDGWIGWYYAFQRMLAEIILSIRLLEKESCY